MTENNSKTLAQRQAELKKAQDDLSAKILRDQKGQLAPVPEHETTPKPKQQAQEPVKLSSQGEQLYSQLDENNPEALDSYGTNLTDANTEAAVQVLDNVQTKKTGEIGTELTNLSAALKDMPANGKQRKGLLSRIFHQAKMSAYEMQTRYQHAGTTINNIADELKQKTTELSSDNQTMEDMFHSRISYYHALTDYIQAGDAENQKLLEVKLPQAKQELAAATKENRFDKEQNYQKLVNYQNRLSKRIYDLRSAQALTYQQIQQLNIIASANIKLIDTINTSISTAIPVWYDQATMALFLETQKEANKANQTVIDATNEMLKENSAQMKNQAIDIVKNSEAPVISEETLENNYNDILDAVKSCQKIIADSGKAREENKKKLLAASDKFHKQIKSALTNDSAGMFTLQDKQ